MARTHRKHLAPSKRPQRGVRSLIGRAAVAATGAGVHNKSNKAQRRATHMALKRGDF